MNARDQRIGRQDKFMPLGRRIGRGVVQKPFGAGRGGKRPEEARDQRIFIGPLRHDALRNSSARRSRASVSSTALAMPASSLSTKALATSTYSVMTTLAGMSLRALSS